MNYKAILDRMYEEFRDWEEQAGYEGEDLDKLSFLGDKVFDFTTYELGVSKLFGERMLAVIRCIYERRTFEFMNLSEEHKTTYLLMVNMPYLHGKLEWGTSIRGAWFEEYGHHGNDHHDMGLDDETGETILVPKRDIRNFIRQLLEWSGETDLTHAT